MSKFPGIEKALKEGLTLEISKGGPDQRLVYLSDPNIPHESRVKGMGDKGDIESSLISASEDYINGTVSCTSQYCRGNPEPSITLDDWILRGNKIDAKYKDNKFVVQAHNMGNNITISESEESFERAFYELDYTVAENIIKDKK